MSVGRTLNKELPVSLANNIEFLRRLPKLNGIYGFGDFERNLRPGHRSPLVETTGFGSNPGGLRMFSFVPHNLQPAPGLVVVLHGCGQTAAAYDLGAGWSTLAKHYGFALLMPQQQPFNNANGCFNWFNPEDTERDSGEACSIRQMIAHAVKEIGIDRERIFVTGLPYGVASNVREALNGMFQSPARDAGELGDLVRNASNHKGPWPKLSVWHGSADRTVNPANANEIVKQWLDVHDLPSVPMSEATVDGYPRQVWWNADGETIVESYTITDMAHGTPLGIGDNDKKYGAQGAFLIEAGISSSYHIAHFFGLTEWIRPPKVASTTPSKKVAKIIPVVSPAPAPAPDLAAVLWPRTTLNRRPEPLRQTGRRATDVGSVITRALTAAGLMK